MAACAITNEAFGDGKAPVVFAWVVAGHQIGAATAAMLAGSMRTAQGSYVQAFGLAGAAGVFAALLALGIGRGGAAGTRARGALPATP